MTLCACQLKIPALMVTAGKDEILVPALSKGMEDLVSKTAKQQHDSQSQITGDEPACVCSLIADPEPEQRTH